MIWNNTGKSISQVQIDFANGQGFQTVTIGTAINISYTDTGNKRWTIKVKLSDNSFVQCYNQFYVLSVPNLSSKYNSSESTVPTWGYINAVSGVRTAATVWVNYSKNNPTGTLRKPLIIVEGYDVSKIAPSLQLDYDVYYFINLELSKANAPGWDFNYKLDDLAGYDLVFVNFEDGAADIVLNAGAVQEVINRVNANKVLDNRFGNIRQQNVVMGLSMGGLCARYALANMTKNFTGTPTETRLLITHDSPHRGANVPLGLQYMIRMLGSAQLFGTTIYNIYSNYDDAISLLNAPATKQLLLYRSLTANSYESNTFLDATYRPMITFTASDPQPSYRFIATSLGNECSAPLFSPGKTFVNLGAGVSAGIDARFLFFRVPIVSYKLAAQVEAYALPATGSTNKIARVYTINNLQLFGFINIVKQLYDNTAYAPGTHLAIDGVPGSNYPLLDVEALNQLTNLPVGAVSLYVSFPIGHFLSGYFGTYAYNAGVSYNFTFVSVGSALDVSPYNANTFTQKYVNGVNQSYPSSGQTFIAQETVQNNPSVSNNVHIRFTARNSRWMFNEMESVSPNNENCSSECSPSLNITGADLFCSGNSIYSIQNLTSGSVTWVPSPPGYISLIPIGNGYQATASKLSTGNVTITATTSCGQSISKVIHVGGYSSSDYPVSGPSSACKNTYVTYSTNNLAGATSYTWFYPGIGTWTYISGQNTSSLTLKTGTTTGNYQVGVRVANACDAGGSYAIANTVVNNCGSFTVNAEPNPTTGTVTVDVADPGTKANISQQKIYEIRVVDRYGFTQKKFRYPAGVTKANLNLNDVTNGIYFIQVYSGKQVGYTQIIISH